MTDDLNELIREAFSSGHDPFLQCLDQIREAQIDIHRNSNGNREIAEALEKITRSVGLLSILTDTDSAFINRLLKGVFGDPVEKVFDEDIEIDENGIPSEIPVAHTSFSILPEENIADPHVSCQVEFAMNSDVKERYQEAFGAEWNLLVDEYADRLIDAHQFMAYAMSKLLNGSYTGQQIIEMWEERG